MYFKYNKLVKLAVCDKWVVLLFAFLALPGPSCSSDNLELLSSTLKTMQQAACDDENVTLSCPTGTFINIQVAQYGKAVSTGQSCSAARNDEEVFNGNAGKCLWPNIMQYSLLQKVVEACQKKPQCKFDTKLRPGMVDPCPTTKKFVEVAYKCRPHEFRKLTACEGETISMTCNTYSRIAVMLAEFGRSAYEAMTTCPQPPGVGDEVCSALHEVELVMQMCHGKRQCEVRASNTTFGSNCTVNSRPYLIATYACVPLGVLTEKYESAMEDNERSPESKHKDNNGDFGWSESPSNTPIANPALQLPPKNDRAPGYSVDDKEDYAPAPSSGNHSTIISLWIYLAVGLLVFIILLIVLIGVRYYISRKSSSNSTNDMFTTPNVFNDVSDIDNDIDVSHISGNFYDPGHPDMILYRDMVGRGTLQAMRPLSTIYPVDTRFRSDFNDSVFSRDREDPEVAISPKSLGKFSNSQFYYG